MDVTVDLVAVRVSARRAMEVTGTRVVSRGGGSYGAVRLGALGAGLGAAARPAEGEGSSLARLKGAKAPTGPPRCAKVGAYP